MTDSDEASATPATRRSRWLSRVLRLSAWAAGIVGGYLLVAYLTLPALWRHYEHQKRLEGLPMVTTNSIGLNGDPINIGLVGAKEDILCAMPKAGWFPADPVTFRSSLDISESVVLDRPYRNAPVSNLFYAGRKQDFAFEKPAGGSADQRHHLRLWLVLEKGSEGRPVWLGAATFDRSVGISRYTGEVTHHIAPDVDRERDVLEADLQTAGMIEARYQVSGVGPALRARNGEGDNYFTDGDVWVMRLVEKCRRRDTPPSFLLSPAAAQFKEAIWASIASLYRAAQR